MSGDERGALSAPPRACPSAPCAPGTTLLGVVGADGRLQRLRTPMEVDADFVAAAQHGGAPEARMRFAGRCETSGCRQWTGTRCGVIERVLDRLSELGDPQAVDALPPCPIRATCRWFDQRGEPACRACSLVVTDASAVAAE